MAARAHAASLYLSSHDQSHGTFGSKVLSFFVNTRDLREMAGCVRVCVVLAVVCVGVASAASLTDGGVNEKCRHNLTKFDPYLSQYIGKR